MKTFLKRQVCGWLLIAALSSACPAASPPHHADLEDIELPIQNYVVIDLSAGILSVPPIDFITLGDDGQAAFSYFTDMDSGEYVKHLYVVQTWKGGVLTKVTDMDLDEVGAVDLGEYGIFHPFYRPWFLLPDGTVYGQGYRGDTLPKDHKWVGIKGTDPKSDVFDIPELGSPIYRGITAVASDGSYAVRSGGKGTPISDEDDGIFSILEINQKNGAADVFLEKPQSLPTGGAKIHYGSDFIPFLINKNGGALGHGDNVTPYNADEKIWDGHAFYSVAGNLTNLNDQNQVLVSIDSYYLAEPESYLWQSGQSPTRFFDTLSPLFAWQLWDIDPRAISSQPRPQSAPPLAPLADADSTIRIIARAQNSGKQVPADAGGTERYLWKRDNAGKWSTYHMKFPDNTVIDDWENGRFFYKYDMAINKDGLIVALGYPPGTIPTPAQSNPHPLLLVPVDMMVDGNRDGEMSFTDTTVHDKDGTTAKRPYRFWINNNHDGYCTVDGETNVQDDLKPDSDGKDDCDQENIMCSRDLEDYSRLWINLQSLAAVVKGDSGISVGLQWKVMPSGNDPTPEIKIFKAVEDDGGTAYLTDEDTAEQQIIGDYDVPVEDVNGVTKIGSDAFILPKEFWSAIDENHPAHLLFEGVKAGKGQLTLVFYKGNQKVGEAGGLYMDLRDIKQFYERWTVGDGNGAMPSNTAKISEDRLHAGVKGLQYSSSDPGLSIPNDQDGNKYILFVHGWNLAPWEKDVFAETALKRLFLQGYKGKFGAFQWPTFFTSSGIEFFNNLAQIPGYDNGEHSAWKSAVPLASRLKELSKQYRGIYLLAHSMGNVVAGEAFRLAGQAGSGQLINSYVASQAAVPAQCYDAAQEGNNPLFMWILFYGYASPALGGPQTPNIYDNWMIPAHSAVSAKESFYNVNDYALSFWNHDQSMKPDWIAGLHPQYGYDGNRDAPPVENGFYNSLPDSANAGQTMHNHLHLGTVADVKDRYEIMAFASEPRSKALGEVDNVNGFGAQSLAAVWPADPYQTDPTKLYSNHPWHSAQFRFTNAHEKDYWHALLGSNGFKLITPTQNP